MTESYQQAVAAERHPIVSLYHVTKRYGKRPALQDVTLHIPHGEFLFMVGPSGAGKSTLMRLIYMEEFPTEGEVTVAGFVSTKMKRGRIPHLRRKVGLIFQDFKLLEDRNVHENVAFPLYVTGASNAYIKKMVLMSCRASACTPSATACHASCRVASSSAWRSLAPWSTRRTCCWRMSRPEISTRM
jgi:ABC-type transporter Mla maintaining outer membrane lipid asymmetry ATPase subunit MlaF